MRIRSVIGYQMDVYGYYKDKFYFEGTPEKIATFILQSTEVAFSIVITDGADDFICLASSHKVLEYIDEDVYKGIVAEIARQEKDGFTPIRFSEDEDRIMIEV